MATKYHTIPPDSTGTSALAEFPPDVSFDSPLLGSVINLPEHPLICYAAYTLTPPAPGSSSDPFYIIEQARKKLVSDYKSSPLLDSLLPSVHVRQDQAVLYVFALGSTQAQTESSSRLSELKLDGLTVTESYNFTPSGLYPCSSTCASLSGPCATCLGRNFVPSVSLPDHTSGDRPFAARFLPRHPLRRPYAQFIQAIRERLIDETTQASASSDCAKPPKLAIRLRDGFLLCPTPSSSEWGTGWEHFSTERPLMHCNLQIHLSRSTTPARIIIHPMLKPTYYLPLPISLPMPAGTPILLLPYGTPAYYLNMYTGPVNALTAQFDEALTGLGAGHWKTMYSGRSSAENAQSSRFVIAWLTVQSKPDEDKGLPIIWPASLCLSYIPHASSLHARSTLRRLPELPAQLQASPPPPAPDIPLSLLQKSEKSTSVPPMSAGGTAPRSSLPASPSIGRRTMSPMPRRAATPRIVERPYHMPRSPTSDSLRAFRSLTLSSTSRDFQTITSEVSGYVEAVAREREKERERMRKEKERESRTPGTTPSKAQGVRGVFITPTPVTLTPTDPKVYHVPDLLQTSQPPSATPHSEKPVETPESPALLPAADLFGDVPEDDDGTPMETDLTAPDAPVPPASKPIPVEPVPSVFDSYDGFHTGWDSAHSDLLSMNMDYGMGFNMDTGSISNDAAPTGPITTDFGMDDDFAFTDDDFSFFDNPSATARTESAPRMLDNPIPIYSGLPSERRGSMPIPLSLDIINDPTPFPYLGLPSALSQPQPSPWLSNSLGDAFTPGKSPPSESHVLSSPAKVPVPHVVPLTPAVQLSEQYASSPAGHCKSRSEIFEPIPFAPSHSLADNKYAVGKFALPTPPDEEDRAELFTFRSSSPVTGWKIHYKNVTDPRVGIIRKLVGAKRKAPIQGGRLGRLSASWEREFEEWTRSTSSTMDADESKSNSDVDEESWAEDDETAHSISRPVTPLPSYLPPGPSLLATYFQHSRLLPLSRPLEPQPAADTGIGQVSVPLSVPTPVSPAAVFGAASEKTKSLEAAAQILVREVTENRLWAQAWHAYAIAGLQTVKPSSEVWQADVKWIAELCRHVQGIHAPIKMQDLFLDYAEASPSSLQGLKPPMLSVAKSNSVIQVLPSSLHFWEKLGFGPRAGEKNISAFVFYESKGVVNEQHVVNWLAKVSEAYKARHLGNHMAGQSVVCPIDGVVPIHFESFRKTLVSFIDSIQDPQQNIIFYIVTPPSILNLTSSVLRQVLSAVKRGLKSPLGPRLVFHFVPEDVILGGVDTTSLPHFGLGPFVDAVYNRLLRPVDRVLSDTLAADGDNVRSYIQDPAFVLARPLQIGIRFVQEAHVSSLDVVERHALLHVGYRVTPCGKWLLATCVDQWGEAHDLKAWLIPDDSDEAFLVSSVWQFASSFAAKASVEWRIVISKFGLMPQKELDAWIDHLDLKMPIADSPPLQVFILSAEDDYSWTFLAPDLDIHDERRPTSPNRAGKHPPGTVLCDMSSATYALVQHEPFPAYTRRSSCSSVVEKPFIAEHESVDPGDSFLTSSLASSTLLHVRAGTDYTNINMLHLHLFHIVRSFNSSYTAGLHDTMRDITRSLHELTELAKARWELERPHLPYHLATLETMRVVLDRGDVTCD